MPATIDTEEEGYTVSELRKQYLDFSGAKADEIEEQRTARHYYHADQLTAQELATLKKRRQPPVIANRIGRKIDGVVGLVERMRQDPKAYARTPQEEQKGGADTATAAIRFVLDDNNWQPLSSETARCASINGIGGIERTLKTRDNGDRDIELSYVDADTFFYDPRSVRLDFSDARFMGVAKWIDLDVAKEMFPDKESELDALINEGGADSVQLQDREKAWIDTTRKRLFLIEHWYIRRGEWRFCYYVADTDLMSGASPFYDENDKTVSKYLMFSANVDHDGDRYGFVRNLKPIQDEINARRSKGLHALNTRRIIAAKGALDDPEKARIEAARPDGYVEYNPVGDNAFKFDDEARLADMKGQVEFLAEAKAEIENFGFNPALIGTGVQDMSGRAIQLQQQAGIAELGPFILAFRDWKIRVYRAIWNDVQRYWTAERWVRVTDDEGLAQYLQINALTIDPMTGMPSIQNHLGELDVDIVIDEGPDTITMQQDTYDTMTALAKGGLQVPPAALIEMSPLDSKTKKKIMGMIEKASQPDPAKQQLEMENAQAEIGSKKGKAMRDMAAAMKDYAEIGVMQHGGENGDQPEPVQVRPPSESIAFKDLPPEGQAQMAAQAGIRLHPAVLAQHAKDQAAQQMAMKAASKPQPGPNAQ